MQRHLANAIKKIIQFSPMRLAAADLYAFPWKTAQKQADQTFRSLRIKDSDVKFNSHMLQKIKQVFIYELFFLAKEFPSFL